jgi:ATP-dependent Clp protease ATP-binding subunit ClpA
MFERFTERARLTLFYARHEAHQLGAREIGPEHLLLGIVREGHGLMARLFASKQLSLADLRERILACLTRHDDPTSTAVEIPFTNATKRILKAAAAAADAERRDAVQAEDLLVGILEVNDRIAAATLAQAGLTGEMVRDELQRLRAHQPDDQPVPPSIGMTLTPGDVPPLERLVDNLQQQIAELRARVERLERQARPDQPS